MDAESVYSDAERAQMVKTVVGEIAGDVGRVRIAAEKLLARIIRLEDSARMIIRVAEKLGTPGEKPKGAEYPNEEVR